MLFKRTYSQARRSRRQWINGSVQVSSGSEQFSALGINLSEGGMGFFAAANLQVGSQVAIEFIPPDAESAVRVQAKIRHRALYLYGVEFLRTNQTHRLPNPSITQNRDTAPLAGTSSETY